MLHLYTCNVSTCIYESQNTFGDNAGMKMEHGYTCVCAKEWAHSHPHHIMCVKRLIDTHGHIAGIKVQYIRTYLCGTVISLYICMYSFKCVAYVLI